MTALTKSEMAERLFEELGLNKREAKEIVELFFEEIRACLENNEQVKLSGFGNFDLRDKSQRPGRNPKTGEEIPISARRVVTFRPGQKLKARVEEYAGTDAGNLANYYAGMSYLNIGDYKKAISYLENFKSEDAILKPLSIGAIGDALSETNKIDDAISHYKKAAEAAENDFTTPRFLFKAAQLLVVSGKKAEANKLFVEK